MKYTGSCHCKNVAFEVDGADPKGKRMAAINIRCLDAIDLEKIPVIYYDGRAV